MAIKLIFSLIVIPISTVLSKYDWDTWCKENDDIGDWSWDDGHLYARYSMNPYVIENAYKKWTKMGFIGKSTIDGESAWIDFCIPETDNRCDWLSYYEEIPSVYLAGTAPGEVVSPFDITPKTPQSEAELNSDGSAVASEQISMLSNFKRRALTVSTAVILIVLTVVILLLGKVSHLFYATQ